VWERIPRIAILQQFQTHFKAKREKGVGTPFIRVHAPLHPWLRPQTATMGMQAFDVSLV